MNFNIYVASSNAHKLSEFRQMFGTAGLNCTVRGARDVDGNFDPIENGKTFEENAFIKALALAELAPKNSYIMADDSGLVVDALNGAPGIFSARYAGSHGDNADKLNNKKLLCELQNVPDEKRTARFVCSIALICPDGEKTAFEGTFEGLINRGECGANGFGYDPLFFVPDFGMTSAQLSPEAKNVASHRGKAFCKLVEFIKKKENV